MIEDELSYTGATTYATCTATSASLITVTQLPGSSGGKLIKFRVLATLTSGAGASTISSATVSTSGAANEIDKATSAIKSLTRGTGYVWDNSLVAGTVTISAGAAPGVVAGIATGGDGTDRGLAFAFKAVTGFVNTQKVTISLPLSTSAL